MSERCRHSVAEDHFRTEVRGGKFKSTVRLWKCARCGRESKWTDKHEWLGRYECKTCSRMIVERVVCCRSDAERANAQND